MRILLILFLFIISFEASAQSVSKQVISTLGVNQSNGTHKLSATVGEVVIGAMTAEDGSLQLGNGYYPSLNLETLSIETPNTNLLVKVFPNPVSKILYITHPTEDSFKIRIADVNGKVLVEKTITKQTPIKVDQYPSGIYLISITTKDQKTNTYKIIKQ
ncbi:MAG: Uncharacterised protein [Polaribacter sp. SA4-10]|nr:MAG: Uncharacterised protein [Polaribacter sp. SA4-10]